ncbi:F-box family protein [Rhynchospora pubera]|uniref:F-box family protein n=1 Tax=Rhynchospora pubera TaxID=906938 RepID=A0AAV8HKX7_9POAL|nr:F-box family protein [Rhynchospora pubera]
MITQVDLKTSNGNAMIIRPSNQSEPAQPSNQPDDDGWITVSRRRSRNAEASREGRIACEITINNLPNSILVHILSFLRTTEAAQTCVLSLRWRYLWTYIPTLIMEGYECNKAKKMNTFLQLCRSPYLRQVTLTLAKTVDHESCFRWVDFAMHHKDVEGLSLKVATGRWSFENLHYSLPENIFSRSQFLRVLVLYGCELRNIGTVDLRNVRKLSFSNINVVGNSLNDLLAACPRAEILKLEYSDSVTDLSATLAELKKIKLVQCDQLKSARLTVPNLQVVKIKDSFKSGIECFRLCGMVNVMEAYIYITEDIQSSDSKIQGYVDLLHNLGQAKQLTMHSSAETMLNWSRVIADCSSMKVLRFKLISSGEQSSLLLMPALLNKFPNLEEFKLHQCGSNRNWFSDDEASSGPNYGDSFPVNYSLQCLKRISILDYNNEKHVFKLVKFLLQNAIVLESISFVNCFGDFLEYLELIEVFKICKASPKAEIVFEDEFSEFWYPDAKDFRVAIS